jgi:hypothetical protein
MISKSHAGKCSAAHVLDHPVIEERFTTSLQKRLAAGTGD